ncbi:hypothetical protein [Streptomyces sp. CBMA152]|uniref:hypothetical protein n=1 Tax=Streptomyces sp. CBMA152 TaxID=1896312 RepID=UPI0016609C11|nr:hypothetical protein [Streptomyces sp. CBMA152]MBD0745991.1 hypothetical protein [Streptomyces sp. CBMA152]
MKPNAEDRIRAALSARAELVTHHDLSRNAPPQGRSWGVRRVRRVTYAVLGAAAAVTAVYLLALPATSPPPTLPAHTPRITEPAPSPPEQSPRVIDTP